jgi:hypothetical protein
VNALQGKRCCFVGKFQRWTGYGGAPSELATQLGAIVVSGMEDRATGRAEAKTKAERLAKRGELAVLDEVGFRELVRAGLAGKSFFFVGGFTAPGSRLAGRFAGVSRETR